MCSIDSLSTFCTFFLSFHPIPVFSFLVPVSESRHHFSFSCTLSYSLLYLDYLIISLLSCLSVSLSLALSSTFTHLPFALNLSTSSLPYLLPSILSSNFAALFLIFTLSPFLLHSSLTMGVFYCKCPTRSRTSRTV
jgi:hypothetical protein